MSHDRGCPCGRERYEYRDCNRGENCYKWDYPDLIKGTVSSDELTYNQKMARLKTLLTDALGILKESNGKYEHDLISSINVFMLKLDERIITTLTEDEMKMILQHRLKK